MLKVILACPAGRGKKNWKFVNSSLVGKSKKRQNRYSSLRAIRELALNGVRNAADFRVKGGSKSSIDKSVHQFQALELSFGKILVSYGQNAIARRPAA